MIGTIIFVISIVESALEPIPICYPSNHGGPGDLLGWSEGLNKSITICYKYFKIESRLYLDGV